MTVDPRMTLSESVVQKRQLSRHEFDALLLRTIDRVRGFVAALWGRSEGIDEIVQDTLLVAWRKSELFSFEPASLDADFFRWTCAIARLEISAYRRLHGREKVLFDDELLQQLVDTRLEDATYFDSRRLAMAGCLKRLPVSDRDLICRRYGEGVSVQDLAASTGRNVEVIYKALRRIRVGVLSCVERALKFEERG
jgi:RNA polymerase sigma-70 factor, ECF subfamily